MADTTIKLLTNRLRSLFDRSRDARWALASQIVTSGANFLTTIILVRGIGLQQFGIFSVCFLLTIVSRSFLIGLVLTPMSTIGPQIAPKDLPAYRGFLALSALAFASLSSLVIVILAVPLGVLLNAPWLPALAWVTAAASFSANVSDFLRRYHFAYEAASRAFLIDALRYGLQLVALMFFAFGYGGLPLSPTNAIAILAVSGLAGAIVGIGSYGRAGFPTAWHAIWPRHWRFIKWMAPATALEITQSTGLTLVAGSVLGEATLGLLRAVESLANLVMIPTNAAISSMPAASSRALIAGGRTAMWREILMLSGINGAAVTGALAAIFVLVLCSNFLAMPWGDTNLLLLSAFVGVGLLVAVRMPLTVAAQTLERPHVAFYVAIVSSTLGVAALFALLPLTGSLALPLARSVTVGAGALTTALALALPASKFGHR